VSKPKSLLSRFGSALVGAFDPSTGLNGRTFERTQGCWNCVHGNYERAKEKWMQKRHQDLARATGIATSSPLGEQEPRVVNIRRLVDQIDHGIFSGSLTTCTGPGVDANENPVGDFVKNNYLCHKWTGAVGASVAREGQKTDPLPMELEDKKGD
jgi:hypothetical protein